MAGWIKLHRQSEWNPLYFAEPFTKWQARCDLILTTSHKDWTIIVRGNIIEIKRGQNWYSEESLASRWKWSRNKVRRFLNYLETIQQIEQHKSKVKSVITLINYEKYQWNDTTDDTTERHQTIQQTDTIKNVNNKKNEKKKEEDRPPVELFIFEHRDKLKKEIGDMFEYERLQVYRNHLNSIVEMVELWHSVQKNREGIVEMVEWCKSKMSILGISSDERLYQTLKRKERHQNKWDEIKNHKNSLLTFFKPKWTQKK